MLYLTGRVPGHYHFLSIECPLRQDTVFGLSNGVNYQNQNNHTDKKYVGVFDAPIAVLTVLLLLTTISLVMLFSSRLRGDRVLTPIYR